MSMMMMIVAVALWLYYHVSCVSYHTRAVLGRAISAHGRLLVCQWCFFLCLVLLLMQHIFAHFHRFFRWT